MNRCVKCGSKRLRAVEVAETVTVGNLEFEGSVQGWSCDACGEAYLAGSDVGSYEALVSRWLAEHGIGTTRGLPVHAQVTRDASYRFGWTARGDAPKRFPTGRLASTSFHETPSLFSQRW